MANFIVLAEVLESDILLEIAREFYFIHEFTTRSLSSTAFSVASGFFHIHLSILQVIRRLSGL